VPQALLRVLCSWEALYGRMRVLQLQQSAAVRGGEAASEGADPVPEPGGVQQGQTD
jgi:hypothetical protein